MLKDLVIVLGPHRSGTSLIARSMETMGYSLGDSLMPGGVDNPKGFWEDIDIVGFNDALLEACYASWDSPILLFEVDQVKLLEKYIPKAKALLKQKLESTSHLAIKDPRMCLLLPFWQHVLDSMTLNVKYIYVYRNPLDVAASLKKRNKLSLELALPLWMLYSVSALRALKSNCLVLGYQEMLQAPTESLSKTAEYMEIANIEESALAAFCDGFLEKELCHHQHSEKDLLDNKSVSKELGQLAILLQSWVLKSPSGQLEALKKIGVGAEWPQFNLDYLQEQLKKNIANLSVLKQDFGKTLKKLTKEISHKEKELTEKDSIITRQQEELNETLAWTQALEEGVKKKDLLIEGQQLELKENISWTKTLEEEVKNKAELIEGQQLELKEKNTWAQTLESDAKNKDKLIKDQQEEIKEKSTWAESLKVEVENKDEIIREKQSELHERTSWAQSLQAEVESRNLSIKDQQKELQKKGAVIEGQQHALQEKTVVIEKQHENLLGKENQIGFLQDEIKAQEQKIQSQQALHADVLSSISYKLGRLLTYPIRKPFTKFILPQLEKHQGAMALLGCLRFALASPIKFIRLLSVKRIWQFTSRLFRRENVLEHVVNRVKETPALEVPDLEIKSENDQKSSLSFPKHKLPRVSVIIPVFNQLEYTMSCLKSIRQNMPEASFEIIVADDCSSDETEEVIGQIEGINYVRNPENLGFLLSCNRAVDFAKGEFVFLLNNDTQVKPGWLDALLQVFDENEAVGLVGSKLIYPDGRMQEAGGIIWDDASGWNYGRLDDPEKPEYNYLKEVDYVSGAAILFPKKLFLEIGKFDERYVPAYYEDTDLAFEIRKKGKKVYMQPKSVVVHFEGISNGKDDTQGIKKHQVINNKKFYEKWREVLKKEHSPNAENVFQSRDRSKHKLTVLVVDHYVPHFDKDAGSRSTFQYLQLMVESGFNVKFIGDNFFRHEPYSTVLESMGVELLLGNYYHDNWKTWIKENAQYIDVAYLHRPHIAERYVDYLNSLKTDIKIIYFGHDLHYLRLQRQYDVEGNEALLEDIAEWKSREWALFKKVDTVMYPSIVEIAAIKAEDESVNAKAIPLYVLDTENMKNDLSDEKKENILFVGGFNHPPNADAMHWFCADVMPAIVEAIPEIKLHIVGSNVPDEIESLACDSIIVHGFLSDEELNSLYKTVVLSIVPLRYGAGIKGKILEAMSLGVPVVTSSIGAEGIPEQEKCMSISDEASGFAKNTIKVYQNKDVRNSMINASFKMLKENFSKAAVRKVLTTDFEVTKNSSH